MPKLRAMANAKTIIMALRICFMRSLYQAMVPPTSSSFLGYFSDSWATCLEVKPLSTSVVRASAVSGMERRNGCLGNSAIIARRDKGAVTVVGAALLGRGAEVGKAAEVIHKRL